MLWARRILNAKKQQIESSLLDLYAQVMDAVTQATACLASSDRAVCSTIIEHDPEINQSRRLIEQDCLVALAVQQPVAHDLREIVAAAHIAGELERVGDYTTNIASIVLQMEGTDLSDVMVEDVKRLSSLCSRMLDDVCTAYRQRDVEKAKQAARMDDEIDVEHANLIKRFFTLMQSNPDLVPNASRMLWIAHNLERCGDRATNIAEQVVFMVDAKAIEMD